MQLLYTRRKKCKVLYIYLRNVIGYHDGEDMGFELLETLPEAH